MTDNHKRSNTSLLWGILLITIGMVYLLQNFNVIYIGSLWSHWPLLFVLTGSVKLFTMEDGKQFGEAVWWIFIGVWLYVSIHHVYGLSFSNSWPLLIIAWGITIITKSFYYNQARLSKE